MYTIKDKATTVDFTAVPDDSQAQSIDTDVQFTCNVDANPLPSLNMWINGQQASDGGNQMRLSLNKQIRLTKDHNGVDFQCKAVHRDPAATTSSDILTYDVTCKSGF